MPHLLPVSWADAGVQWLLERGRALLWAAGKAGTGNLGRGFPSRPIGLRFECSPKDYLIGCGLGFRIKVWHLPKNWVGAGGVGNTRGPQDLPGSAQPSWVSESPVSSAALARACLSPSPACASAGSGERKLVNCCGGNRVGSEFLSPVLALETEVCENVGLRSLEKRWDSSLDLLIPQLKNQLIAVSEPKNTQTCVSPPCCGIWGTVETLCFSFLNCKMVIMVVQSQSVVMQS